MMDDPFPSTAVADGGTYVWKDGRDQEDTVYALYEYPKGFMCRYLTGLGNSADNGCKIYGTNGMFSETTWSFTGTGGSGKNKIQEEIKVQPEPGENHMKNWMECIRSRKQTNAPIEVGYQHSVACILGYQALLTGRKLKYLPVLRRIVEA
jgi:predicted dehydrogenase